MVPEPSPFTKMITCIAVILLCLVMLGIFLSCEEIKPPMPTTMPTTKPATPQQIVADQMFNLDTWLDTYSTKSQQLTKDYVAWTRARIKADIHLNQAIRENDKDKIQQYENYMEELKKYGKELGIRNFDLRAALDEACFVMKMFDIRHPGWGLMVEETK